MRIQLSQTRLLIVQVCADDLCLTWNRAEADHQSGFVHPASRSGRSWRIQNCLRDTTFEYFHGGGLSAQGVQQLRSANLPCRITDVLTDEVARGSILAQETRCTVDAWRSRCPRGLSGNSGSNSGCRYRATQTAATGIRLGLKRLPKSPRTEHLRLTTSAQDGTSHEYVRNDD